MQRGFAKRINRIIKSGARERVIITENHCGLESKNEHGN